MADSTSSELDWNMNDSGAQEDYMNVYVNAFWSALKEPSREWSLDDVLNANWSDSDWDEKEYSDAAGWVRGWH